jgi:Mrp family chromosome partitioning ATPase
MVEASEIAEEIVGFRSRDSQSRPFNLLRTQIMRLVASGNRLIGLTSATPQVGKTFIACNLAASLSRLPEHQTFLLDLDLRRGSVADRFNLPVEKGMTEYLDGTVEDLASLAWGVKDQRLVIHPSRSQAIMSSELLSDARFSTLIEVARASAPSNLFVFDLPPVFANDDAMIIVEKLDGYIFVVEDGVTTKKQIRDAMRLLGREKCFGTVLNRYASGFAGGEYGYGYGADGKYADYYN